jgi:hypothetical protein
MRRWMPKIHFLFVVVFFFHTSPAVTADYKLPVSLFHIFFLLHMFYDFVVTFHVRDSTVNLLWQICFFSLSFSYRIQFLKLWKGKVMAILSVVVVVITERDEATQMSRGLDSSQICFSIEIVSCIPSYKYFQLIEYLIKFKQN